jgi:hypothetical protein
MATKPALIDKLRKKFSRPVLLSAMGRLLAGNSHRHGSADPILIPDPDKVLDDLLHASSPEMLRIFRNICMMITPEEINQTISMLDAHDGGGVTLGLMPGGTAAGVHTHVITITGVTWDDSIDSIRIHFTTTRPPVQ